MTLARVIDVSTLQGWIVALGFKVELHDPTTLLLTPPASLEPRRDSEPQFYVQCTENWVLLSILPLLEPAEYDGEVGLRLLAANRDMRTAKFALDKNGAVVLCAELPTESLDRSEIEDAVTGMVGYARRFRDGS